MKKKGGSGSPDHRPQHSRNGLCRATEKTLTWKRF